MRSFLAAAAFSLGGTTNAFNPSLTRPAAKAPSSFALHAENDRRGFLVASGMAAVTLLSPIAPALADDVDYKAVAKDIMDLVKQDPDKGPSKFFV